MTKIPKKKKGKNNLHDVKQAGASCWSSDAALRQLSDFLYGEFFSKWRYFLEELLPKAKSFG